MAQAIVTDTPLHVLWIICDDLNDYVWNDGNETAATPQTTRLASMGSTFSNCYSNSPICCPSRVSFTVGKTPEYSGVYRNFKVTEFRDHFDGNPVVTIPEHFRENGYYSIGFNKIFHNFWKTGFDNDFEASEPDPLARGLSWNEYVYLADLPYSLLDSDGMGSASGYRWGMIPDSEEHLLGDTRTIDSAIQVLRDYQANPTNYGDQPIFMALGLVKPHVPHVVPEKYFPAAYESNIDAISSINYYTDYNPSGWQMPNYGPGGAQNQYDSLPLAAQLFTQNNFPYQQAIDDWAMDLHADGSPLSYEELRMSKMANADMAYYASVKYIDAQIGRILDELDSLGMTDETIIVLHSDHGFTLGERLHWSKETLWEQDLRVPLIIVDPRKTADQRIESAVSLIDIFPTLCDLAGIDHPVVAGDPDYLDGHSLDPLMDGQLLTQPVWSFVETSKNPELFCGIHKSVRQGEYHLSTLTYNDTPCSGAEENVELLYDLSQDPNEYENLAESPEHGLMLRYMQQFMQFPVDPFLLSNFEIQVDEFLSSSDYWYLRPQVLDSMANPLPLEGYQKVMWLINPGGYVVNKDDRLELNMNSLPFPMPADSIVHISSILIDQPSMSAIGQDRITIQFSASPDVREANTSTKVEAGWYDLSGRRISTPEPFQFYINELGEKMLFRP
jgi:arylsulfatase A-like enzyme